MLSPVAVSSSFRISESASSTLRGFNSRGLLMRYPGRFLAETPWGATVRLPGMLHPPDFPVFAGKPYHIPEAPTHTPGSRLFHGAIWRLWLPGGIWPATHPARIWPLSLVSAPISSSWCRSFGPLFRPLLARKPPSAHGRRFWRGLRDNHSLFRAGERGWLLHR